MKCPLLRGVMFKELPGITLVPLDCLRDKCSWWYADGSRCAILALAVKLDYLCQDVSRLALRD